MNARQRRKLRRRWSRLLDMDLTVKESLRAQRTRRRPVAITLHSGSGAATALAFSTR